MRQQFDVIILGSGPSASRIAEACSKKLRVAVVESNEPGGTCALRGCNPKKVLVRAAELIDWAQRSDGDLIYAGTPRIDWKQLIGFTKSFTEPVPRKTVDKYDALGVTLFEGTPEFTDRQSVSVSKDTLEGTRIVICTGARPAPLEIPGANWLTTSAEFMAAEELPKRIAFVGGGYISFEFAHVAIRAGADVTVFDHNPRPLSAFEPQLVDQLVDYSRKIGIQVNLDADVTSIEETNAGYLVRFTQGDDSEEILADMVVHGAGRVPAIDGLQLEQAAIDYCEDGIVVNDFLQSVSNPNVYAAGDVAATDQPKLTPVANQQGRTVSQNLLAGENQYRPDYGVVPRVVFTVPGLASIGLTEEQAAQQDLAYDVFEGDRTESTSMRKVSAPCAGYKILVDRDSGVILGAHLIGPDAAESINLFALAMKFGLTATDIKSTLFAFPTFSADVRSML